jgi:hypothetical protein
MKTAGYSGTPLAKKLGIKPGFKIRLVNPPSHYKMLFTDWPEKVEEIKQPGVKKNFIHYFVKENAELAKTLILLKSEIVPDGMIWVSWPKKASKIETDITEDVIRNLALKNGLVDIKVCAVDETWSGLKLVIPVKER